MKKFISYALVAIFIASFALFCSAHFGKAKAATEKEVYEATNTYALGTIRNEYLSGYNNRQYIISYDMNNKLTNNIVADSPPVTVFTHGYDSAASDWMNNAENGDFETQYNPYSMVNKVVELNGLNNTILLVAKMEGYDSFKLTQYVLGRDTDSGKIEQTGKAANFNIREQSFGKHYIIVFDSYNDGTYDKSNSKRDSNDNVYYQFNYMLSYVLYDLKQIDPEHKIPKVNLIGHSRGGLTNLQYALDHPDIVENLISIGTPYRGSSSATVVQYTDNFGGDGLNDIINSEKFNHYRDVWNNNYDRLYSKINAMAIGAYSTLPFLSKAVHNDKSGKFNNWTALLLDAGMAAVSAFKVAIQTNNLLLKVAIDSICRLLYTVFPDCIVTGAAEILANEVQALKSGVVWLNDGLVPIESQVGGIIGGLKGFQKRIKRFSLLSRHKMERVAQWNPPVVHNLEPWDEDITDIVMNELRKTRGKTVYNGYRFVKKESGVTVTGYVGDEGRTKLEIPSTINGYDVVEIAPGAFGNETVALNKSLAPSANAATYATTEAESVLDEVEKIVIPSSVKKIGDGAFKGLKNLESVVFGGSAETDIGKEAFAYCERLRSVNFGSRTIKEIKDGTFEGCVSLADGMPYDVEKIGEGAFGGCENFDVGNIGSRIKEIGSRAFFGCYASSGTTVSLPSEIEYIGDGAFAGIPEISGFDISSFNENYSVKNDILYNKSGSKLCQYPAGKNISEFIANVGYPYISDTQIDTIGAYAFYGCNDLEFVDLAGVVNVEDLAFVNCENLTKVRSVDVENVSVSSFAGVPWVYDEFDRLNGCLSILYYTPNSTENVSEMMFKTDYSARSDLSYILRESLFPALSRLTDNGYAYEINYNIVKTFTCEGGQATVALKDNLRYSDGTSVTAEDFIAYYEFVSASSDKMPMQWQYVYEIIPENDTTFQIYFTDEIDPVYVLREMRAIPSGVLQEWGCSTPERANVLCAYGEIPSYGKYSVKANILTEGIHLVLNEYYTGAGNSENRNIRIAVTNDSRIHVNGFDAGDYDLCYNLDIDCFNNTTVEQKDNLHEYDDGIRSFVGVNQISPKIGNFKEERLKRFLYGLGLALDDGNFEIDERLTVDKTDFYPDAYNEENGNRVDKNLTSKYTDDIAARRQLAREIFAEELEINVPLTLGYFNNTLNEILAIRLQQDASEAGLDIGLCAIESDPDEDMSVECDLFLFSFSFKGGVVMDEDTLRYSAFAKLFSPLGREDGYGLYGEQEYFNESHDVNALQGIQNTISEYAVKLAYANKYYLSTEEFDGLIGGNIKNLIY